MEGFNPKKFRSVHIAGIGGIGVSRLARYFLHHGVAVSGSDLVDSEQIAELRKLGASVSLGPKPVLPPDCDLLIYSIAVPDSALDRLDAKKRGLLQLSHFEAIALIAKGHQTIAIAGTNGKSTTTAMLGLMAEQAGLDPTVFVGSYVREWGSTIRLGKGKLFIVEADELKRQFLALEPFAVVLTNIETDHLDYYRDLKDIREAFAELVGKIPLQGFFAFNRDDDVTRELIASIHQVTTVDYGRAARGVALQSVEVGQGRQRARILLRGKPEEFELRVPALYNIYNALAANAAANQLHIPFAIIKKTLAAYHGIWRRFEILGTVGTTLIISDYGHHPTAIRATLAGIRQFYPGKKVLLAFQPHQRHRTAMLFDDFIASLLEARPEKLIIAETFYVPGRDREAEDAGPSGFDLFEQVSRKFPDVSYARTLPELAEKARKILPDYDLAVFMGAGDINTVAEALVKQSVEGIKGRNIY